MVSVDLWNSGDDNFFNLHIAIILVLLDNDSDVFFLNNLPHLMNY